MEVSRMRSLLSDCEAMASLFCFPAWDLLLSPGTDTMQNKPGAYAFYNNKTDNI